MTALDPFLPLSFRKELHVHLERRRGGGFWTEQTADEYSEIHARPRRGPES